MASITVPVYTEATLTQPVTDESVSQTRPNLEEVESRLVTLSENINLCDTVLNDLKRLRDVLTGRSPQDVSVLPQQ